MPPDSKADNLAHNSLTSDVWETLVAGLSAYGRLYGLPNSPEQVRGILGTMLRLYQPESAVIDRVSQQVLDHLTPEALKAAIVSRVSSALAKEAHRWQQHLTHQAKGVLTAYAQRYAPAVTPDALSGMATTVVPLLSDRVITRSEAVGLVSQVAQTFDLEAATTAIVDPAYLALAQTLHLALSQKPMAKAVGETVIAYVQNHAPHLTTIGADLIATALSAVLKNQVDFNIDTQLTVVDERLLIEQVSFHLNILQELPMPSKAAWAIVAQVNATVEQYLQERQDSEGTVDVAAGLVGNDGLSISSPLTSARSLNALPERPSELPPG
ncbi:MAG: hypothetical protein WBB18_15190 [Nodosilinea sp.]